MPNSEQKMFENLMGKCQENGSLAKNDKTERASGLGIKTREDTGKGESNDSPEIPDRDIWHPWFPFFGVVTSEQNWTIWI